MKTSSPTPRKASNYWWHFDICGGTNLVPRALETYTVRTPVWETTNAVKMIDPSSATGGPKRHE